MATKVLPRRLSFLKICDVLIAYLNAGADKEYVGVSEVSEKSSVTLHNISRNNNFLKSWGFIEESEKEQGKYKLTREAAEFAYAYRIDPESDFTRQLLRNILSKEVFIPRFVERIKNEGMNRDAVLVELPRIIGDLRADKVGLNAFLDLIAYAFKIDWLYAPTKPSPPKKAEAPGGSKTVRQIVKKVKEKVPAPSGIFAEPRANISINLTVSPEVTPNLLKEYVKAMLKAYDEYFREKAEEESRD
ncbi:MAG: hypothetical protein N3E47_00720 [Candidatus Bathyarchaeota archaeon]|nr:hypothetical protein [Candidatus Bathyarchaeota archaeon]